MHFTKFKGLLITLLSCCVFQILILQAECSVGVTFSLSVQKDDPAGPNTKEYDMIYVSTLLEHLTYRNFSRIGTYGVGAPNERYVADVTWRKAASIANTSIAAAQINRKENKKVLSVYQGVYVSEREHEVQLDSEINLGFEMASKANSIWDKTVEAILFPSITGIDFLFSKAQKVINTSKQCKLTGLKLGARVWDCHKIQSMDNNDPKLLLLLKHYDFIICQFLPNDVLFESGPTAFLKTITKIVEDVTNKTGSMEEGRRIEVMLESGWPAEEQDEQGVSQMSRFWNGMRDWAEESNKEIFLQEAFDNPWKKAIKEVYKGDSYGLLYKKSNGTFTNKFDFKLELASTNAKGGSATAVSGGTHITPITFLCIGLFVLFNCLYILN